MLMVQQTGSTAGVPVGGAFPCMNAGKILAPTSQVIDAAHNSNTMPVKILFPIQPVLTIELVHSESVVF
jgi:hypothetical protein